MRKVLVESRMDCGLRCNFVMLDQMTAMINPTWGDAQLRMSEVEVMTREILRVGELFASEESWANKVVGFL